MSINVPTTSDLDINGKNARETWGIIPNTKLMASLLAPPAVKDPVQSNSRLEHGTRTIIPTGGMKLAKREFTLELGFSARSFADFHAKYNAFIAELTGGWLRIETRYIPDKVFKCRYVSCTQFTNYNGRIAKFILKLEEPNPNDRTP